MPKDYVGIDIGSQYTKILRLVLEPVPSIIQAFTFPTPYGSSLSAPTDKIDEEQFIKSLEDTIGLGILRNSKVGLCIPSSSINAMYFSLPKMKKRELKVASLSEARRKMIPPTVAEDVFDYTPLEERGKSKIPKSEVFVARANSNIIKDRVALFRKIGVIPSLITITPIALLKSFYKETFSGEEDVTFVDIGVSSIDIAIAYKGQIRFFRSVSNACKDIISGIASGLGVSMEEAEHILKQYGVPEIAFDIKDRVSIAEEIMRQKYERPERPEVSEGINMLELRLLLQPHLERIINELRRSFIYYKEQTGGERVERILFSGGGSLIKNLVPALAKQIGGKCEATNIARNIHLPVDKEAADNLLKTSSLYACAFGLALGADIKRHEVINFLPPELLQHEQIARIKLYSMVLIVFLSVACALAYLNSLFTVRSLSLSLEEKRAKIENLAPLAKRGQFLKKQALRMHNIAMLAERLTKENLKFEAYLIELTKLLPQEVILTSLDISETTAIGAGEILKKPLTAASDSNLYLKLLGNILSTYEEGLTILDKIKTEMNKSPYFKDATVIFSQPETISPQVEEEGFPLTARKMREFRLEAQLNLINEK